jgi:hypothetical protein
MRPISLLKGAANLGGIFLLAGRSWREDGGGTVPGMASGFIVRMM